MKAVLRREGRVYGDNIRDLLGLPIKRAVALTKIWKRWSTVW